MKRLKVQKFKSKILQIEQLTSDVKHLKLSTPEDFDFSPGQFISIVMDIDGKEVRRPYSIASKPSKGFIDLCVKILPNGRATPTINKLKKGDELTLLGPMGGFTVKDPSKDLVFISTGTGITPFRSMIHHFLEDDFPNKIKLCTGFRFNEHKLYKEELENLEKKYPNFSYDCILSRAGKESERGHVQKIIKENVTDVKAHYYICGLKEMVNSVKDLLLKKGVPKESIFFERYD